MTVTPLKEKIVEKIDNLSELELQEMLDFADFLLFRRQKQEASLLSAEICQGESAKMDEECSVHYVGGVLVVKAALSRNEVQIDWNTVVDEMREERIRKFIE